MFKKRSVASKSLGQNKRKKFAVHNEGHDDKKLDMIPSSGDGQREGRQRDLTRSSAAAASAANFSKSSAYNTEEVLDSDDESKFKLSANDDATKEDTLNAEKKLSNKSEYSVTMATSVKRSNTKQIIQPANIRTTILTDYQPDICKDYQKTGYCGYGDSCKFLHIREDFKGTWNVKREWEDRHDELGNEDHKIEIPGQQANHPFEVALKCYICKKSYKSPVMVSCGHTFCSSCFTKSVREDTKCRICGKETHGVAKMASKLRSELKKTPHFESQK